MRARFLGVGLDRLRKSTGVRGAVQVAPALILALGLAGVLAGPEGRLWLAFAAVTAAMAFFQFLGLRQVWRALLRRQYLFLFGLAGLLAGVALYVLASLWLLRPGLLPQRIYYDFIANRQVTERLVDPALLKVERWEIQGEEGDVLFTHPAAGGSTALVYPVRIEPGSTLRADLALAPQAWISEGDGVVFSVYVEDDAGMHLAYSRYVDPKHHQEDRRWLPVAVDLRPHSGKLVRVILAVNSGPAGDSRFDWAGWGWPRLERPLWP